MLKQRLTQKQTLNLSPQQIQLMKLVQLPVISFIHEISNLVEENPLLEFNYEDDEKGSVGRFAYNSSKYSNALLPEYETENTYIQPSSLSDYLQDQLNSLFISEEQKKTVLVLINYLDANGYLQRSLDDISNDLAFNENIHISTLKLQTALDTLQTLEPHGIGAVSLQNCLIIQLEQKKATPERELALTILENYFELFSKKKFNKITEKLKITANEITLASKEILVLNPKPGSGFNELHKGEKNIIPDFILTIENDTPIIRINKSGAPSLKINDSILLNISKETLLKKEEKKAFEFLKENKQKAEFLIGAIKQRELTLTSIVNAIINYQKEYFLTNDYNAIKPMVLKTISDITSYEISTVSRAINSKYIDTPFGIKSLKALFSEGFVNSKNESISSLSIKNIIKELIEEEPKNAPYSDSKLVDILEEKQISIARRTVTKYRKSLGFLSSHLRKN